MNYYDKIIRFLATGFGVGEFSMVPGTLGSLVALILLIIFPFLNSWPIIILSIAIGVYISQLEENRTGVKDDQAIVIDEMAGLWLTFALVNPVQPWHFLVGFVLFRFFDITKLGPIDYFQNLKGGLGVMLDDISAGLVSAVILYLLLLI